MGKAEHHSISLGDETYSILSELSKNLKKSIPETIHAIATGNKIVHGVLFTEEHICLNCSHRPSYSIDKCPSCGGPVITRYVKSETRRS
jgi:rRNA maturation endonuclease Nob1